MALEPPLSRRLGVVRRRDKPESGAARVLLSALDRLRPNSWTQEGSPSP